MYHLDILGLIKNWGYIFIFAGMFLEGMTIPFPGAMIVLLGGSLAGTVKLNIYIISGLAVAGYILGAFFPFYLARLGGRKIIYRYGKYMALTPKTIRKAERIFEKYGCFVVCLSRPFFFGNYISYLAGLSKMPLQIFLLYTLLGVIPWCVTLSILGYYFGQLGIEIFRRYSSYGLLLIPLLIVLYLGIRKIYLFIREKIEAKLHI